MLHDKLSSIQGEAFSSAVMQELMKDNAAQNTSTGYTSSGFTKMQGLVNSTLAEKVRVDYSAQQDATAIERMALGIAKMKSDVVARVLGK